MTQNVLKPTRHRNGQDSSVLDLVSVYPRSKYDYADLEHLSPLVIMIM